MMVKPLILTGNACLVSDLHIDSIAWRIGSGRVARAMKYIENTAQEVDHMMLGGDIFELHQSRRPIEKALEMAAAILKNLAKSAPKCHFHFFNGNHDDVAGFPELLAGLKNECRNLHIYPTFVRTPSAIFFHGDQNKKGKFEHREFTTLEKAGEKRQKAIERLANPSEIVDSFESHDNEDAKRKAIKRLRVLKKAGLLDTNVEDIFIGHTHRACVNFEVEFQDRTYYFHNAGGLMEGATIEPVMMCFDNNGIITSVRSVKGLDFGPSRPTGKPVEK